MSYIWPDLRDRYLQSLLSRFETNPAVPVSTINIPVYNHLIGLRLRFLYSKAFLSKTNGHLQFHGNTMSSRVAFMILDLTVIPEIGSPSGKFQVAPM